MKILRNHTGYTLIELLLYVALLGILLSGVAALFGAVGDARVKNQTITEVNDQGRFAIDYMTRTVRNATSITVPALGATGASLSLVVPTGSLSPTVFSISNGVLQVQEGSNAAVALTSSDVVVSNLTVKNVSRSGTSGVVQISLTLDQPGTSTQNQYDYQRTFTTSAGVRP